jgi:transposase-like protein
MPRRKHRHRWTPAEAHSVMNALASSGLSPGAFAEREGLDVARLYRWRRRFAGETCPSVSTPAPSAEVIEIRPGRAEPVEVVLVSGVVLRVSETIDPSVLGKLVVALERGRC